MNHYSHAAPFIREKAAYYAYRWREVERTQKAQAEARGTVFGFVSALQILLSSPEGATSAKGIANRENIPQNGEKHLRAFLGEQAWKDMGFEEDEEALEIIEELQQALLDLTRKKEGQE